MCCIVRLPTSPVSTSEPITACRERTCRPALSHQLSRTAPMRSDQVSGVDANDLAGDRRALIGGQQNGDWAIFVGMKNPLQGGLVHDFLAHLFNGRKVIPTRHLLPVQSPTLGKTRGN